MEEINLKELFDYIKERIGLMIIIVLAVLIVGGAYSLFIKTPMYKSTSTLVLVSDEGTNSNNQTYTNSDVQLNQNLVSTYSEIVKSRRILESVIDNLKLDYTFDGLKERVNVSTKDDTEIIVINVLDEDPAVAADVANEIVKVFSNEIKDIYKLQNVSTIDIAQEAKDPSNINLIKDAVIYILIGIILAGGVVFLLFYFDTSVKSAEDIENKLGLPVLGIIPKVKYKDKK